MRVRLIDTLILLYNCLTNWGKSMINIGGYKQKYENAKRITISGNRVLKNYPYEQFFSRGSRLPLGNGCTFGIEKISVEDAKNYLSSQKEYISLEQSLGLSLWASTTGFSFCTNAEHISEKPTECTGFSVDGLLCQGREHLERIVEYGNATVLFTFRGLSKGPKIPKMQRDFNHSIQDLEKL